MDVGLYNSKSKYCDNVFVQENMDIYDFVLSSAEVNCLKKLDKGDEGRIFNFLFWKGVENHPEYPFKIPAVAI